MAANGGELWSVALLKKDKRVSTENIDHIATVLRAGPITDSAQSPPRY